MTRCQGSHQHSSSTALPRTRSDCPLSRSPTFGPHSTSRALDPSRFGPVRSSETLLQPVSVPPGRGEAVAATAFRRGSSQARRLGDARGESEEPQGSATRGSPFEQPPVEGGPSAPTAAAPATRGRATGQSGQGLPSAPHGLGKPKGQPYTAPGPKPKPQPSRKRMLTIACRDWVRSSEVGARMRWASGSMAVRSPMSARSGPVSADLSGFQPV